MSGTRARYSGPAPGASKRGGPVVIYRGPPAMKPWVNFLVGGIFTFVGYVLILMP